MVCVYPQPTHIPQSLLEVYYYFQIILADIDLQWFRLFPMILQQTRIPQLYSKGCSFLYSSQVQERKIGFRFTQRANCFCSAVGSPPS